MFSIILVIISIALLASVAAVSINHVPLEAYQRQLLQKEAQAGLEVIEKGVGRYLNSHRDGSGNIIYPGDGVNMVPLFAPSYGYLPADVQKQMTWEVVAARMAVDMPAVSICLHPIDFPTPLQQTTLAEIKARLPMGSAFLSTDCRATADSADGTHLTYWLPISHIN